MNEIEFAKFAIETYILYGFVNILFWSIIWQKEIVVLQIT